MSPLSEAAPGDQDRLSAASLRPATQEDWAAVAALHTASWRDAYRGILSESYLAGPVEEDRRRVWRNRLAAPIAPDLVTILAEGDPARRLAGFCCIMAGAHETRGSLIDNLHVRPGSSRRGVGRRLLARAVMAIPPRFAEAALHLTVFEANPRARAAYERWGGECVESHLSPEPDGAHHRVLRFAWSSPAHLLAALAQAGPT